MVTVVFVLGLKHHWLTLTGIKKEERKKTVKSSVNCTHTKKATVDVGVSNRGRTDRDLHTRK